MLPLTSLRGVGDARLRALNAAGIETMRDLLFTLPADYKNTRDALDVSECKPGDVVCLHGFVKAAPRLSFFSGKSLVSLSLTDGKKTVRLQYFNQPWMKDNFHENDEVRVYGKIEENRGQMVMNGPSVEHEEGILPLYKRVGDVPGKVFQGLIRQALQLLDTCVTESLPECVRRRWGLCEINFALRECHFPDSMEALDIAKRRLQFESLLLYLSAMQQIRGAKQAGIAVPAKGTEEFWHLLPFPPTGAQRRVLEEIAGDLRGKLAMTRLVQGDVGSGKTAVALGAIYLTAKAGFQSALMAPTEILARQHMQSAQGLLGKAGISCGLLVGGMKQKEKKAALEAIKSGRWQCVIGTHALLSEEVEYGNLALVVTDEQHRFGVKQRKKLSGKAENEPNALVMSATPIPRSLALILYGDLDLSVIDEMPPGRTPVRTRVVPEEKRPGLYEFIKNEAKNGHQTYIVCPLVSESEQIQAKSAQEMYAELSCGALRDLRLGLTYGNQEAQEKEKTIGDFSSGKIDVLISTTVIEVGVNVPSASVMVIENADRFGLSQLHQLRGRVGRGAAESWCFLMAEKNERLKALCATNDGFEIAREDLKQRGPGDLMGVRQHGTALGQAFDVELISQARDCLRWLREGENAQAYEQVRTAAKDVYQHLMDEIIMN